MEPNASKRCMKARHNPHRQCTQYHQRSKQSEASLSAHLTANSGRQHATGSSHNLITFSWKWPLLSAFVQSLESFFFNHERQFCLYPSLCSSQYLQLSISWIAEKILLNHSQCLFLKHNWLLEAMWFKMAAKANTHLFVKKIRFLIKLRISSQRCLIANNILNYSKGFNFQKTQTFTTQYLEPVQHETTTAANQVRET